jgi:hypothetical protein
MKIELRKWSIEIDVSEWEFIAFLIIFIILLFVYILLRTT